MTGLAEEFELGVRLCVSGGRFRVQNSVCFACLLQSDFESTAEAAEVGGEHRLRKRSGERPTAVKGAGTDSNAVPECLISTQYCSDLPTAASHCVRKLDAFGLGGGTVGSEGYGEATPGSVHKLGIVLQYLRQLVLVDLQPGLGWGMLWDLGPSSTFLDIGSGYGKVAVDASRLFLCTYDEVTLDSPYLSFHLRRHARVGHSRHHGVALGNWHR